MLTNNVVYFEQVAPDLKTDDFHKDPNLFEHQGLG